LGRTARPLYLSVMPAAQAIAAFNAGKLDVVLGGSFTDLPPVGHGPLSGGPLGKGGLKLDPVVGLFGLVVENEDGLLAHAANREALSMAIDRASLTTQIGVPGWQGTTRLIAPGSEADTGMVIERWADMDLDGRRTLASQRIAQWARVSGQGRICESPCPAGRGRCAGRSAPEQFCRHRDQCAAGRSARAGRSAPDRRGQWRAQPGLVPAALWLRPAPPCLQPGSR
jgi:peptide/nickel transport system substrate-binding protein/oligopeptide transport system substrate-binding protein